MPSDLTINRRSARYQAWTTHRVLTAPLCIALLIIAIVTGSSTLGLLFFDILPQESIVIGTSLLAWGVASGLLLLFIFAATYFPYVPVHHTSRQVSERAAFSLLRYMVRHADHNGQLNLGTFLPDIIASPAAQRFLARLELKSSTVTDAIAATTIATDSAAIAQSILRLADTDRTTIITIEHVVAALLIHPALATFLRHNELQEGDIMFVAWWQHMLREERRWRSEWWKPERILQFTGIGLSWTAGYTPLVDQFARIPRGNLWDQISYGRTEYVERLITTLARQEQSNVLLVGQPGVGRLGVIRQMAQRVRANRAHPALTGQRIVYVHVGELLARGTTSAAQLALISQALREMERAGNIIAIIDGLSSILSAEGESHLDLTEVLLPFFSSLSVRVVVVISTDEYHLRLKTNEELIHFFEVIQIPPASPATTLHVVALAAPRLEQRLDIILPYKTLRELVEGTTGILQHIPFPERAFDVLEEAIVIAQGQQHDSLRVETIHRLISQKVGVPMGRLKQRERNYLLDLENIMHQRLVNQDHAVSAVARAMIRARAGVRNQERPIATFLFLGPTGVGKTETAKTLAEAYFGADTYVTRLDMSEFQGEQGVATLIGNPAQPVGRLTALIADTPFTVLLLDEFEKAHRAVQQLFLQVFDEGHLTDARGHTVSFQHAIIIATSNAGAEYIRQHIDQGPLPPEFDHQLQEQILQERIFTPELINRFDGVITFTPLSIEHIQQVAVLMLKKLNRRLDAEHGITIAVTDDLIAHLVQHGYDPKFGARPMQRAIQNTVEYAVARLILERKTQPGQQIVLTPQMLASATHS